MSRVSPVPEGHHTVTPYLIVGDVAAAMDFYGKAFGAEPVMTMPGPGGQGVMHGEIRIGDSMLYVGQENPAEGSMWRSPLHYGGSPVSVHLYVEDADALFARATKAGAEVVMPMMDAPWGDRYGSVKDPQGHVWSLGTHVEDLEPEEIGRRMKAWFERQGDCD